MGIGVKGGAKVGCKRDDQRGPRTCSQNLIKDLTGSSLGFLFTLVETFLRPSIESLFVHDRDWKLFALA